MRETEVKDDDGRNNDNDDDYTVRSQNHGFDSFFGSNFVCYVLYGSCIQKLWSEKRSTEDEMTPRAHHHCIIIIATRS